MNRQNINEYYIGETPGVREIYNCIHNIRTKYKITEKKMTPMFIDPNINCSPEMLKLNRAIEKEFGFNPFCLAIAMDREINAMTFTLSARTNSVLVLDFKNQPKKALRKNKQGGFCYDPRAGMGTLIFFYYGLFFNPEFTDREITAILLHEIGHNFEISVSNTIAKLSFISSFFLLLSTIIQIISTDFAGAAANIIISQNSVMNLYIKIEKFLSTLPGISTVANTMAQGSSLILGLLNDITQGIRLVFLYPLMHIEILSTIMANIVTFPVQMSSYQKERFADSFAVTYGYGKDLSMALDKIQIESANNMGGYTWSYINKIPVIGHLVQLYYLPYTYIKSLYDVHPETHIRINEIISQLEKELNEYKLDPKTRKEIKSQINDLEKSIKKYNESIKGVNPKVIQATWLNVMTNGIDTSTRSKLIDAITKYDYDKEARNSIKDLKFL